MALDARQYCECDLIRWSGVRHKPRITLMTLMKEVTGCVVLLVAGFSGCDGVTTKEGEARIAAERARLRLEAAKQWSELVETARSEGRTRIELSDVALGDAEVAKLAG